LNASPEVKNYLRLQLAMEANEVFGVIFLNQQHRILAFEKLFQGTINEASVYPRVIVQRALHHNAASLILAHNHPSGDVTL
jgi:DNA repair protein RadC